MTPAILAILLALTPSKYDSETPAERHARMTTIATAIDIAARGDRQVAALLIVQGTRESHWARHIHAGKCGQHPESPKGECDADASGPRAGTPWQLWYGPWLPRERWLSLQGTGLEATTRAAQQAARIARSGLYGCGPESGVRAAFARWATSQCRWSGAGKRVAEYRRVLARLP